VNITREWVEELDFDRVQRGIIQKRKVFNDEPVGTRGIAFNTRRAPFDDIRVRQALAHLLNRDLLIEKLYFNEYFPLNSYYAGSIYENPGNPKMPFDPKRALSLLAEAGWNTRDAQGRLTKDGRPLTIEVLYYSTQVSEPYLTIYQDDLRKVGITLNLRLVTPETQFQLISERKFELTDMAWGGLVFPNPETSYHSRLADQPHNNNITGFKDKRLDALLTEYDTEFNAQKRAAIIREIDGILASQHHYILAWYAPFTRLAYWNKFGQPDGYLPRTVDSTAIPYYWWFDTDKQRQLADAMRDGSKKLEIGPVEVRYWQEYAKRSSAVAATSQ
jgi:microcin C transport system substrate-binding protein